MNLSAQHKRRLTLAIGAHGRARMYYGRATGSGLLEVDHKHADKLLRRCVKAEAHLLAVVRELVGGVA